MTGRIYTSVFDGVTVALAQDLFQITPGATAVIELLSVHISQELLVADAAEEMWTIAIEGHSGAITDGSGGTTPAVVPTSLGDAVSVTVVKANNTTEITGGTKVTHAIHNMNVRVGWDFFWPPEQIITIAPTDALTVTLRTVPTSATVGGTIYFRELGGV